MMNKTTTLALLTTLLLLALPGHAADSAGNITLLTGRATAADSQGNIRNLQKNGAVFGGEVISTGPNSYLNIRFSDGGRILLRPNTRFQIQEYQYAAPKPVRNQRSGETVTEQEEGNAVFRLLKGGFRAITGLIGKENRANYKVATPVATIGIRGTDFEARLCAGDCADISPPPADGLYTGVFEGGINVENAGGVFEQDPGQYGFIPPTGEPPVQLRRRPKVLGQDPMPDPEACGE